MWLAIVKSGKYQAVVIGVSAGGIAALEQILPLFEEHLPVSVLVTQHVAPDSENYLVEHFKSICSLKVVEAFDKQPIEPGVIYFAAPNYHLLVEKEKTVSLSIGPKVNYSRPSIDVMFETAAEAYCQQVVGVILTGANTDGSRGLAKVKKLGGLTVVQDPRTAYAETMPQAAIGQSEVDRILPLERIGPFLISLDYQGEE